MSMTARERRLPKWAQSLINILRTEADRLGRENETLRAIIKREHIGDGRITYDLRRYDLDELFLPKHAIVRFRSLSYEDAVAVNLGVVKGSSVVKVTAEEGQLDVRPVADNQIYVTARSWKKDPLPW